MFNGKPVVFPEVGWTYMAERWGSIKNRIHLFYAICSLFFKALLGRVKTIIRIMFIICKTLRNGKKG